MKDLTKPGFLIKIKARGSLKPQHPPAGGFEDFKIPITEILDKKTVLPSPLMVLIYAQARGFATRLFFERHATYNTRFFIQVLFFLCLIYNCFFMMNTYAQTTNFDEHREKTRTYYQSKMQEYEVTGGALLFLENGESREEIFYGMADLDEGRKVTKETIFHWASITKTFTAVAIMQLRDEGLLGLDDPLTDFLPDIRNIHNPYGSMDDITIRMALNHSTGLRNSTWPWGGNEDWHPFEPKEWEQLVAMFPYSGIEFEPGSRFSYSNPAIIFLGKIIEQLSGDPYEVYVDKNILKPLGMAHSYFNHTPKHLLHVRSNSYNIVDGHTQARGLDFHTGITTSNGGLNAPLDDMINYLNFLTGATDQEFEILKRESLEELWQKELPAGEKNGIETSMALSFFVEEFEGMRVIGHTGTQHSFYSFFYIHPESKTAVISVTNSDQNGNMHRFREELIEHLFKNLYPVFKTDIRPEK